MIPAWVYVGTLIAQAGASIYGSKKAADAQKKAAESQEKAAREALGLQKEMYLQDRADAAPWTNVGGQAMNTLGSLMGLPQGPVQGPNAQPPPLLSQTAQGPLPPLGSHIRPPGTPSLGTAVPRPGYSSATFGGGQAPLAAAAAPGVSSATFPSSNQMVPVRTPDGRVVAVPRNQLAEAQANGGQPIG
jgi:hypothetical protein